MGSGAAMRAPYFAASRDVAVGYVFIVPLIVIYEAGVMLEPSTRNGADPLFRQMLWRFGPLGMVILHLFLLALLFFSLSRVASARRGRPGIYGTMFLESVLWAVALRGAASLASAKLLALPPFARTIVMSAGAGIYEEVVFRVGLLGGMFFVLRRWIGAPKEFAAAVALVLSSALFSLAHHGIGGELWDENVFLFRALMGMALGGIFLARGLGIAVYAHALYNVFVLTLRPHA